MTETTDKIIEYMQDLIHDDISSVVVINDDKPVVFAAMNKDEELETLNLMINAIVGIGKQCNIKKRFEIYQGLRDAANAVMRGEK